MSELFSAAWIDSRKSRPSYHGKISLIIFPGRGRLERGKVLLRKDKEGEEGSRIRKGRVQSETTDGGENSL